MEKPGSKYIVIFSTSWTVTATTCFWIAKESTNVDQAIGSAKLTAFLFW